MPKFGGKQAPPFGKGGAKGKGKAAKGKEEMGEMKGMPKGMQARMKKGK